MNQETNQENQKAEVEETELDQNMEYAPEGEEFSEELPEGAEKESHFQEGQDLTFVSVRFPGNAKSFPFLLGNKHFHYGQKVVAMSDRGMTVGYINSFPYVKKFAKSMLPIFSISKVANDEDLQREKQLVQDEKKAERVCNKLIERHKLEMDLTHVEFTQYGKKAVFFFTAPNRVDFRNLVKDLVGDLKMRIELRQISVRDRAAALGAVGPCGLQTCCSSFHNSYGNVTIKMAKGQNLALMPNKINGVCGQIKCCIKYEHELYAEKRKMLPKENSLIQTRNGDKGKVLKLNILEEEFEMITSDAKIRRYTASQFFEGSKLAEDFKMPEQFESNIINETQELIGKRRNELDKDETNSDVPVENEAPKKEEQVVNTQATPTPQTAKPVQKTDERNEEHKQQQPGQKQHFKRPLNSQHNRNNRGPKKPQ